MSVNKTVGKNIRSIRRAKDISQESLALGAGAERSYMSIIERGKGNPSVGMLEKIAKALDVRIIDFFKEEDASS